MFWHVFIHIKNTNGVSLFCCFVNGGGHKNKTVFTNHVTFEEKCEPNRIRQIIWYKGVISPEVNPFCTCISTYYLVLYNDVIFPEVNPSMHLDIMVQGCHFRWSQPFVTCITSTFRLLRTHTQKDCGVLKWESQHDPCTAYNYLIHKSLWRCQCSVIW